MIWTLLIQILKTDLLTVKLLRRCGEYSCVWQWQPHYEQSSDSSYWKAFIRENRENMYRERFLEAKERMDRWIHHLTFLPQNWNFNLKFVFFMYPVYLYNNNARSSSNSPFPNLLTRWLLKKHKLLATRICVKGVFLPLFEIQ